MTDISLDLETLGTGPGAAIVAIGAYNIGTQATFYERVILDDDIGRIDPGTVAWWMRQETAAIRDTFDPNDRVPIRVALDRFTMFANQRDIKLWTKGPAFDEVILLDAMKRLSIEWPQFRFWNSRCVRTILDLVPSQVAKDIDGDGIAHTALDDARNQGLMVEKCQRWLAQANAI